MDHVTVRKLDHAGHEVISYPGEVLWRSDCAIVVRSHWEREPMDLGFVVLEPHDQWTETFYSDRWYNVFEIRSRDGHLKGWYCNVTRPARISEDEVAAEDLALDLWVAPGGDMKVLDQDEFGGLALSLEERRRARQALAELMCTVGRASRPFEGDPSPG